MVSAKPGIIGNSSVKKEKSILVALLGQVPVNPKQVRMIGDVVKTLEGLSIGYLLASGEVYLKSSADEDLIQLKSDNAAIKGYLCNREPQAPFCSR